MVRPGAVVIDVGINRVDDPTRKSGYRLVGDVEYEAVARVGGRDHAGARRRRPHDSCDAPRQHHHRR